jgi:PAS domain S-box-containing protein
MAFPVTETRTNTKKVLVMAVDENISRGDDSIEQALAGGSPQRVGWFRFYFDDQRWEWSEEVQRLHGYEPGTVVPTTAVVLSHKHPEDRRQVAATIDEIVRSRQPFSTRHRIIDVAGNVHAVVVVGDQLTDERGTPVGTQGFYIDVTEDERQDHQERVTVEVAQIAENRAAIEQTKGMLMVVYGVHAPAAFNLLKWRSQETNVKLRRLCEQIAEDFIELTERESHPLRSAYDNLLLTAHLRVTPEVEGPESSAGGAA